LVSNYKLKIPQTQIACSNDYIKKTHNSILFILPVLSEKVQRIPSWVLSHLAERNQGSAAVLIQVDHGDELYFRMLKYKDTDQNLKQTKGLITII